MSDFEEQFVDVLERNLLDSDDKEIKDYFSWGRDARHKVDNTEKLSILPRGKRSIKRLTSILLEIYSKKSKRDQTHYAISKFREKYQDFEQSYRLMSNNSSRELFCELIAMQIIGEKRFCLSSFEKIHATYETASNVLLESGDEYPIYGWLLKGVSLDDPAVNIFTVPTILNLHFNERLYEYGCGNDVVRVEKGDCVIDAGIGWGDTTVYLAAKCRDDFGGKSYAFDILDEGLDALRSQLDRNPDLNNVQAFKCALSDTDDERVFISAPSPGARITKNYTGREVRTKKIDTFVDREKIEQVNFIKMDIEGAEVPAIKGATNVIKSHHPKLALSVYHKWDDMRVIPRLINTISPDYNFYLDCTTGFGGEAVLYAK